MSEAEQVYYDALVVLKQAVNKNKLDFTASKNLKSYVFKIAELKIMEMNRENKRHEKISNSELPEDFFLPDEVYDEELDLKLERLILLLEIHEHEILISNYFHNENLKTIALRLGISEENCRVIKFRALKKLRVLVRDKNIINA